jgi:hypothetical protein
MKVVKPKSKTTTPRKSGVMSDEVLAKEIQKVIESGTDQERVWLLNYQMIAIVNKSSFLDQTQFSALMAKLQTGGVIEKIRLQAGDITPITEDQKRLYDPIVAQSSRLIAELHRRVVAGYTAKVPKVRQSRWFIDQLLVDPVTDKNKLDLFQKTKDKIAEHSSEFIPKIGINLTVSQRNVVDAIMRLLRENSENKDEDSDLFYAGNTETTVVNWGNDNNTVSVRVPRLKIKTSDFFKTCLNKDKVSGRDAKDLREILTSLEKTNHLIRYNRKYYGTGDKEPRHTIVETYSPLLRVVKILDMSESEYQRYKDGDAKGLETNGEMILELNPVLTDQISKWYVETPVDLRTRLISASGGTPRSVTTTIRTLFDVFNRAKSHKWWDVTYDSETLYGQLRLAEELRTRKGRAEKSLQKAIDACIKIGIILSYEVKTGANGQNQYAFKVNKDFS